MSPHDRSAGLGGYGAHGAPTQPGFPGQAEGEHDRLPARGAALWAGNTPGAGSWLGRQGGVRNLVRQEIVARQLGEQLTEHFGAPAQPLRVLDVGCGQGTQALRLARAGHLVTALDPDPITLGHVQAALAAEAPEVQNRTRLLGGDGHQCGRWFDPGSFDLVLCHGVLMYLSDPDPLLASLARMLAPGGLLSLVVRNGDALAMRAGLSGDWRTALHAFEGDPRYASRRGYPARADRLDDLTVTLAEIAVPLRRWYGVRVFTDTTPDDAPPPVDGRQVAQLLDAEERAGQQDPYRRVAALMHLVGAKRP